mmetsp:Transcript_36822/g.64875  ORF Transcript_36822/g.64875 Transcript_36822/m.64875 type:complete len:178 (+) Transcript_36822:139-672(+)
MGATQMCGLKVCRTCSRDCDRSCQQHDPERWRPMQYGKESRPDEHEYRLNGRGEYSYRGNEVSPDEPIICTPQACENAPVICTPQRASRCRDAGGWASSCMKAPDEHETNVGELVEQTHYMMDQVRKLEYAERLQVELNEEEFSLKLPKALPSPIKELAREMEEEELARHPRMVMQV